MTSQRAPAVAVIVCVAYLVGHCVANNVIASNVSNFAVSADGQVIVAQDAINPVNLNVYVADDSDNWRLLQTLDVLTAPMFCPNMFYCGEGTNSQVVSDDGQVISMWCMAFNASWSGFVVSIFQRLPSTGLFVCQDTVAIPTWEAAKWAMSGDASTLIATVPGWSAVNVLVYTRNSLSERFPDSPAQQCQFVCLTHTDDWETTTSVAMSVDGAFAAVACGNDNGVLLSAVALPSCTSLYSVPASTSSAYAMVAVGGAGDTVGILESYASFANVSLVAGSGVPLDNWRLSFDNIPANVAFAMSSDATLVAVGYGTQVVVYSSIDGANDWTAWAKFTLDHDEGAPAVSVLNVVPGGLMLAIDGTDLIFSGLNLPVSCDALSSCDACITDSWNGTGSSCVWCLDSGACTYAGNASCADWVSSVKYCPAPPPPSCSSYEWNCTGCLTAAAAGPCRFCLDSSTCTSAGTTCENIVKQPKLCPAPAPPSVNCSMWTNCTYCVDWTPPGECEFCWDTMMCVSTAAKCSRVTNGTFAQCIEPAADSEAQHGHRDVVDKPA